MHKNTAFKPNPSGKRIRHWTIGQNEWHHAHMFHLKGFGTHPAKTCGARPRSKTCGARPRSEPHFCRVPAAFLRHIRCAFAPALYPRLFHPARDQPIETTVFLTRFQTFHQSASAVELRRPLISCHVITRWPAKTARRSRLVRLRAGIPRGRARIRLRGCLSRRRDARSIHIRFPLYFAKRTTGAVAMLSDKKASAAMPIAASRLSLSLSLTIMLNRIPSSSAFAVNPEAASYGTSAS